MGSTTGIARRTSAVKKVPDDGGPFPPGGRDAYHRRDGPRAGIPYLDTVGSVGSEVVTGRGGEPMYYKFTLQEHHGSWVQVITFGKDTPSDIVQVAAYSDHSHSAEDLLGIRHHVYFKDGKIVQIQLHDALRILPHLDPERPETNRMPAMHAIMFGDPPEPTLLVRFKEVRLESRTAYGLSPNVYLVFHEGELAELYVHNGPATLAGADQDGGVPGGTRSSGRSSATQPLGSRVLGKLRSWLGRKGREPRSWGG